MFANPIHAGYFRDADGRLVKGIHEAIIPIETWQATQRLTATRCKLQTKIDRPFPLVGLLHCGSWGTMMIALREEAKWPHLPPLPMHQDLPARLANCPMKEVNADRFEAWVLAQLRNLRLDEALLVSLAAANESNAARAEPLREQDHLLGGRLAQIQQKLDNLGDALAAGGCDFPSMRSRYALEEANLRVVQHE